ncbi:MAG: magnesium transporter MgtE N-terminal domain-containing protein [Acidimicrobiales bacterium]
MSKLIGSPLVTQGGETIGKLDDLLFRLREGEYPLLQGLVVRVGGRQVFMPIARVLEFQADRILLTKAKVDLRGFERRSGEVLLREDILGHRLIDVDDAELVWAWDVDLEETADGWVLCSLDTRRRPARLFASFRKQSVRNGKDWKAFEPLIGHSATELVRRPFRRVRRFKPAQIADLVEDASRSEGEEIMEALHEYPELEADVFGELDPDVATRLFGDKSDEEVAAVIELMRSDDAADAVAELPQERRVKILDLLTPNHKAKIMNLMAFNASSAGGIMSVDYLTCPVGLSVQEAIDAIRQAGSLQVEVSLTVHVVDGDGRVLGVASVVDLLRADPSASLDSILDREFIDVLPTADVVDVAVLMADFNLLSVPVLNDGGAMLGVITVDDILEATIPDEWRRREPAPRSERHEQSGSQSTGSGG